MQKYTDRQTEIIEAATARIDKYGIQNLTIKNLAQDLHLSEPALYRHFKSKNEILSSLLKYFIEEMKNRLDQVINSSNNAGEELRAIFNSQLQTFSVKPAIVSVLFAESIFHFDKRLSHRVSAVMDLMHDYVTNNIRKGQDSGHYSKAVSVSTLTTIIIGGMRMTVLKWKLSGHNSNLIKDGKTILEGILSMIENN